MDYEWNIFPGFNTLQFSDEVKWVLLKLGETPENFTGRIIFMSMFNDIFLWIKRQSQSMHVKCQSGFSRCKEIWKRTMVIHWSWFWKKWYSTSEDSPQGEWDRMAEKMMLEFGESGHPVFRATSPLSWGQLKSTGGGKLSIHYCADLHTIKTVVRTIIFVNQLSLFGAVAEMCEEYETSHDRTGQPVVGGQSSS